MYIEMSADAGDKMRYSRAFFEGKKIDLDIAESAGYFRMAADE
jgi:hypothetical protein